MTRRKKLQSRWNGRRSSGPTSDAGREASAQAALKHGAHSDRTLLPDEDPAEFDHLLQLYISRFPGEDAQPIATALAKADWLFQRLSRFEDELLAAEATRLQVQPEFAGLPPDKIVAAAYRSLIDKRSGLASLSRHAARAGRRHSQLFDQVLAAGARNQLIPPAENSPVSQELPVPIDKPAEPAVQPAPAPGRFVVLIWVLRLLVLLALRRISALLPHPSRGTPIHLQTTEGFT